MDCLNAVHDGGVFDDLCFFVVGVVVVFVVINLVGLSDHWSGRVVEWRCARWCWVAVCFAYIDGFVALGAGVEDVVFGDALHL